MVDYFGESWGAPCDEPPSRQVPTPVGKRCYLCEDEIVNGDQGPRIPQLGRGGGFVYAHLRCFWRSIGAPETVTEQ